MAVDYWFDQNQLVNYWRSLPKTDAVGKVDVQIMQKYAVVTHDDFHDEETCTWERKEGVSSSWFMLPQDSRQCGCEHDFQFHFDKQNTFTVEMQIGLFKKRFGHVPLANRTHRIMWRADHLDLLHLSLHGFKMDSSKLGVHPYRLVVEGRLLPILEVPMSGFDNTLNKGLNACGNLVDDPEKLFIAGLSPIVFLFHPFSLRRKLGLQGLTEQKFVKFARKYGYELVTLSELYHKELCE